jgi:hypothetical protein
MFLRNALAWRAAIALASWIAIAPFGAVPAQAQEYQGHAPWCANRDVCVSVPNCVGGKFSGALPILLVTGARVERLQD